MQVVVPGGGKMLGPALESTIGKVIAKSGITVLGKVGRYEKVAKERRRPVKTVWPE
jgi:hypothetical protein